MLVAGDQEVRPAELSHCKQKIVCRIPRGFYGGQS